MIPTTHAISNAKKEQLSLIHIYMETGLKGIEAMEDFYRAISMPTNLKELGIDPTEEQLETMAKNARIAAGGPKGSAKKLEAEDMLKIYQMAAGK